MAARGRWYSESVAGSSINSFLSSSIISRQEGQAASSPPPVVSPSLPWLFTSLPNSSFATFSEEASCGSQKFKTMLSTTQHCSLRGGGGGGCVCIGVGVGSHSKEGNCPFSDLSRAFIFIETNRKLDAFLSLLLGGIVSLLF